LASLGAEKSESSIQGELLSNIERIKNQKRLSEDFVSGEKEEEKVIRNSI
jgi:hypothetical protein